jgi:hypothetical protein
MRRILLYSNGSAVEADLWWTAFCILPCVLFLNDDVIERGICLRTMNPMYRNHFEVIPF